MQASTPAPPQTIDEIIAALNAILDQALRQGERIGYFAALYERVTTNVRRALVAGNVFQDNARMERLDVVFANRFLHAWDQHRAGAQPSRSWQVAFGALDDPTPLVVQHLLLGMNAHINLDLGIAAATVAPNPAGWKRCGPTSKRSTRCSPAWCASWRMSLPRSRRAWHASRRSLPRWKTGSSTSASTWRATSPGPWQRISPTRRPTSGRE